MDLDTLRRAAIEYAATPDHENRLDTDLRRIISDDRRPDEALFDLAAQITGTPVNRGGLGAATAPHIWAARLRSHLTRWAVKNNLHKEPRTVRVGVIVEAIAHPQADGERNEHDLADAVRFNLDTHGTLSTDDIDPSAFEIIAVTESDDMRLGAILRRFFTNAAIPDDVNFAATYHSGRLSGDGILNCGGSVEIDAEEMALINRVMGR